MIVSSGSRRQPGAERSRGQGMNVLSNKWGNSIALLKKKKKEIVVAALDSKHSNDFCLVGCHTQTLFFGQDDYQMSMHLYSICSAGLRTRYKF